VWELEQKKLGKRLFGGEGFIMQNWKVMEWLLCMQVEQ
jgi:hypothetical protein